MVGLPSLRELGELRVIQIMEQSLGNTPRAFVGFGDDVAAVRIRGNQVAVLKTDMLVGSTDIPPGMTMRQVAWKAIVANVSDLAAKGVEPIAGLVALGLPSNLKESDVLQIARGLSEAARSYSFPIVGGDTNASEDLVLSIALFALADPKRLVLRDGARNGDIVAVTGKFGSTAAGLKALLSYEMSPEELPRELYNAVYRPRARLDLGLKLAASRALTSSIDSSDGLAWSLHQLSESSEVGILIEEIPVSKSASTFAKEHHLRDIDLALYGGEEYELVVTVPPRHFSRAHRAAKGNLMRIGVVSNRFRGVRMKSDGAIKPVKKKGWEHFKRQ